MIWSGAAGRLSPPTKKRDSGTPVASRVVVCAANTPGRAPKSSRTTFRGEVWWIREVRAVVSVFRRTESYRPQPSRSLRDAEEPTPTMFAG